MVYLCVVLRSVCVWVWVTKVTGLGKGTIAVIAG